MTGHREPAGRGTEAACAASDDSVTRPDEAARDEHAATIGRLFQEHNEQLLRFLLPRVGSRQTAREVAQEAYVRLLKLDEPGTVSYLRAFLYRTAANLAIDYKRRQLVHTRTVELPLFHEFSDARTPERRVAGLQEIERLDKLLSELPPRCRQAFIMNRFYGLDFSAVAADMNVSERSARLYVERALLHCRERMDEEL